MWIDKLFYSISLYCQTIAPQKILNIVNIWFSNLADQEAIFLPIFYLWNYEHMQCYRYMKLWKHKNFSSISYIFQINTSLFCFSKCFKSLNFMMDVEILSQLFWECKLLSSFYKWKKNCPFFIASDKYQ